MQSFVLLSLGKRFHASPAGWVDLMRPGWRLPFVACNKRGWIKALGSGRVLDRQDFTSDELSIPIQERCRSVFALLHDVQEDNLIRVHDRVSVQPSGSPKLAPHTDGNRRGSYQAVICLSDTSFLVYPGSHKAEFLPEIKKHY